MDLSEHVHPADVTNTEYINIGKREVNNYFEEDQHGQQEVVCECCPLGVPRGVSQ